MIKIDILLVQGNRNGIYGNGNYWKSQRVETKFGVDSNVWELDQKKSGKKKKDKENRQIIMEKYKESQRKLNMKQWMI